MFYSFLWLYNDDPLNASDTITMQSSASGYGSLVFREPTSQDEGVYQCVAYNSAGTALGPKINFRQASKFEHRIVDSLNTVDNNCLLYTSDAADE